MTQLEHLLVADGLFRRLGWGQQYRPSLYLGAIAPDAHRVSFAVERRGLHFAGGRRIRQSLSDFLRKYLRPALLDPQGEEERAFYAGWLSHIVADRVMRHHVRDELSELWQQALDTTSVVGRVLRDQFYEECDWVDARLAEAQPDLLEDIRELLQQAATYHTIPPLRLVDIQRWRTQVVAEMLPVTGSAVVQPQLTSVEFIQRCLQQAVEESLQILDAEVHVVGGLPA